MRIRHKLISVALSLVLLLSMAIPATVNAQITYDPQASGNNGIYIDTFKVPNDSNISVSSDGKAITAKRNVTFKLYCSVDARWSIEAADSENLSVENGSVYITVAGEVVIKDSAKGGNYTITATAENVTNIDTATIKLSVDSVAAPARAESIMFDSEEMDNPQMTVSNDGKTLTIDGKVEEEKLAVKFSPEYLFDTSVSFSSTSSEAYSLSGDNNSYITSVSKSSGTILRCTVGTEGSDSIIQTELNVVINEKNLVVDFISDELQGNNYNYTVSLDQKVHFNVTSNQDEVLPERNIKNIKWSLRQDNQALEPSGTKIIEDIEYNIYDIYGSDGRTAVRTASVFIANSMVSDSIIVETEKSTSATIVNAVTLSGQVSTDSDTAGNEFYINTVTLNFNTNQVSSPSRAYIDFDKAGLEQDVDYSIKQETLNRVATSVYYFEADGKNLNLSDATFGDVQGVRSFEESKDNYFSAGQTYKINYGLSSLADSVFGSAGTAKMYNNSGLSAAELDSSGLLVNNNKFTKQGTGYMVLTVQCMRGTTEVSKISYILRFVSQSSELNLLSSDAGLKVSKNSNTWYGTWEGEVVHIRRGEAVVPGFYKFNEAENRFVATDAISIYDPYVEYSVSDADVASATPNTDGTYRINGLESGVVTITAVGAVNKENEVSFEIYVNKDIYEGRFEINFTDAITNQQMNSAFVVNGKQTDIPVNINALDPNMGIPVLSWSLDCNPGIATINPETGAITTKTSSSGQAITVIATSASGEFKASQSFTIAEVEATSIVTLSEKIVDNVSVVTRTGDNAGSCKVGDSFTLYASSYTPVNATKLSGAVVWSSSNPEIATVSNGVVTALAETAANSPVKITASYTPTTGGTAVETVYNLTISGYANPIQSITANPMIFDNVNALSKTIDLTFTPENTPNKTVTYVSSNPLVATVSENGLVTPVGVGSCTITITSAVDTSVSTTVSVTVNGIQPTSPVETQPVTLSTVPSATQPTINAPEKTTVSLSRYSAKIYVKGATSIKATVKNGQGRTSYRSSNPKIAKVSSAGKVTGVKKGTATIIVTNNGVSKFFNVTVNNPKLNAKTKTIKKGNSFTLRITGKIGKAKFTSSNKKVATVTKKGKINAKKKGKTTITVKTNGITLKCKVTVR